MQVRVDYERFAGNTEAELHAAKIEELRARLRAEGSAVTAKISGRGSQREDPAGSEKAESTRSA